MSKSDRSLRLFAPGKFFLYSTKNKINTQKYAEFHALSFQSIENKI